MTAEEDWAMKTETAVILLIAATFIGGIAIGAAGHKTLTEKPATPSMHLLSGPGTSVLLENAETNGVLTITLLDTTSRFQWIAPGVKQPIWKVRAGPERGPFLEAENRWEYHDDACQKRAFQAPNTREAQPPAATQRQTDTLDPQTREWYRLMAEKGFYPMVIMVPRERDRQGKPR